MPYCKHDRNIKGGQKKVAFLCRFFRPTSDVNISKSVYPIYLKIKVQRVPTSHSSHINFWVNRITRFRDIDVGSWPKKTTKKTKKIWPPFIYIYIQHVPSPKESNLTTWQPDNLTLLSIDMKTKVVQHDNYHDDYYDYHDNYHDDYHNENHDYRDDYHDAWTLNLSHLVHLWKHCFPCLVHLY